MSSKPAPKDAEQAAAASAADTPKTATQAAPEPEREKAIPGRLAPGVYAYTAPSATLYLDVPITARPADSDQPATVFDWWQTGPPADGRWEPTRKKPNQAPDNAAAPSSEE